MKATYHLNQVMEDPRSGEMRLYPFDEYETLADAKAAAKREFKNAHWVILESRMVAHSTSLEGLLPTE